VPGAKPTKHDGKHYYRRRPEEAQPQTVVIWSLVVTVASCANSNLEISQRDGLRGPSEMAKNMILGNLSDISTICHDVVASKKEMDLQGIEPWTTPMLREYYTTKPQARFLLDGGLSNPWDHVSRL
jgi:hypothetical protein